MDIPAFGCIIIVCGNSLGTDDIIKNHIAQEMRYNSRGVGSLASGTYPHCWMLKFREISI
jgi:hypothetical protein